MSPALSKPLRSFACQKGSLPRLSTGRASEHLSLRQLSGDSFRTSSPQGGVLGCSFTLCLILWALWLKKKEACSTLSLSIFFGNFFVFSGPNPGWGVCIFFVIFSDYRISGGFCDLYQARRVASLVNICSAAAGRAPNWTGRA